MWECRFSQCKRRFTSEAGALHHLEFDHPAQVAELMSAHPWLTGQKVVGLMTEKVPDRADPDARQLLIA